MLPWQTCQSYLSVRSRIRDVINLTYDVIEVTQYHSWALYTLNIQQRCIKTPHSMQNSTMEHAGEGFMPLRSIVLEIWTREAKKSRNFRKFDIWPDITGSNIDLGPKIIPPIASTRRVQSLGRFREALQRFVWKRHGGSHPPPLHRRRWQNTVYGRGLESTIALNLTFLHPHSFVFLLYQHVNTFRFWTFWSNGFLLFSRDSSYCDCQHYVLVQEM